MLKKTALLLGLSFILMTHPASAADKFQAEEYFHSPWLGLSFFQDGQKVDMVSVDPQRKEYDRIRVKLDAKPFEIQVPIRSNNDRVRICVWNSDEIFNEIAIKTPVDGGSVFGHGQALPGPVFSPPELFITNSKHNLYSNWRLTRYSRFYTRIPVSMFSYPQDKGKRYHISKQDGPMYMVVFMNLDMDGLVEREELEFFILDF
ncbi:hypothetical protein [Desulfovibrio sp. JC010]|uniref:hypothetical protein n=1 Tax=Desulfovibrio sp. JC010 TaxID=2593641 RepID=UPI0013D7A981|nr:hypothetical protein [Desulfovibrio sp. JC010]NDV25283.1 hypothetical protein [Desulfovibrio sp. JC010]